MQALITDVAATGNQLGMVHSIQYRKPEVFPLCKKGSASFTVLTSYLAQMDEDYFLNSGYYEEIIAPANPDDTLAIIHRGRKRRLYPETLGTKLKI